MKIKNLFGIIIISCIFLTSCNLRTDEISNSKLSGSPKFGEIKNSELINEVEKIEKYDYKLNTFQTSYIDYKKNTDEFMSSNYSKDDEVIFAYSGTYYKGKDLINMPMEKFKELGNKIETSFFGSTKLTNDIAYISTAYYEKNDTYEYRYVFTKHLRAIGNSNLISYKKYYFKKDNNTWKIFNIDQIAGIEGKSQLDANTLKPFITYNNEPIKYIKTSNFFEDSK